MTPTPPLSLGIDLGGSCAKLAALGGQKRPATATTPRYRKPSLTELSRHVRAGIERLEAQANFALADVAAIGLCVPGPVDAAGSIIRCTNLPCLDGLNGHSWLQGIVDQPIKTRITTDQHAAAHAEYTTNAAPGRTLYLALGTGVGGAVLDNGKPLGLTNNTPGHLGHIDVSGGDPDAPSLPTGGRGSLEAYLGTAALIHTGLPINDPAACANHPAMDRPIRALAQAIRIAFALYRMDRVVLLGGNARLFAPVLPRLIKQVADNLTPVAPEYWTLKLGTLGPTAAAQGVATLAQNHTPGSTNTPNLHI